MYVKFLNRAPRKLLHVYLNYQKLVVLKTMWFLSLDHTHTHTQSKRLNIQCKKKNTTPQILMLFSWTVQFFYTSIYEHIKIHTYQLWIFHHRKMWRKCIFFWNHYYWNFLYKFVNLDFLFATPILKSQQFLITVTTSFLLIFKTTIKKPVPCLNMKSNG